MHSVARDQWLPFEADIVVYDQTGTRMQLLVEVKREFPDIESTARALSESMLRSNCHNGLLVTPERMLVYRDTFEGSSPDAIVLAGELATERILGSFLQGKNVCDERELAQAVVAWLRALSENWFDWLAAVPNEDEVVRALLPGFVGAVAQGRVVSGTENHDR